MRWHGLARYVKSFASDNVGATPGDNECACKQPWETMLASCMRQCKDAQSREHRIRCAFHCWSLVMMPNARVFALTAPHDAWHTMHGT